MQWSSLHTDVPCESIAIFFQARLSTATPTTSTTSPMHFVFYDGKAKITQNKTTA